MRMPDRDHQRLETAQGDAWRPAAKGPDAQGHECRERMKPRLLTKRGRVLYRLRGQNVEPVFGQMKENQGADRSMMRGEQGTRGGWSLHCVAHNLSKLHSESVRSGNKGGKWLRN